VSSPPANPSNHQVDQKLAYQFLDGDLNTGLSLSRVQGLIQATEATTGIRNTVITAPQAHNERYDHDRLVVRPGLDSRRSLIEWDRPSNAEPIK
jgi:hypothetical protein